MNYIKEITNLLNPEVWAIYIIGFLTISLGLYQLRRNFRDGKKISIFEEISNSIQVATDLTYRIGTDYKNVIEKLAASAQFASDYSGDPSDKEATDKLIRDINENAESQKKLAESVYSSHTEILLLIKKVEKSTLISRETQEATRRIFYEASEEFELQTKSLDLLLKINATPPLGQKPNIDSATFNQLVALTTLISTRVRTISDYLEDLEVILHNDLVKKIFGKAHFSKLFRRNLRPGGSISDSRLKDRIL